jgi:tRNA-dihydrouridine synthase B
VMIGRAAATNPWIFSQMQQFAETGRYTTPTEDDRYRLLIDYYGQICAANLPDGVGKMKQFACWFTHGVGNGSELRRIVHAARTPSEVLESVERFFEGRAAGARLPGAQEMAGHDAVAAARIEDPAHGPSQHVRLEAALGT